MKKGSCFSLGTMVVLLLLFAAGPGVAGPDQPKQKVSAPERPKAMREVVLMRDQVRPLGESVQSKKIRQAKQRPAKKEFRAERGLRAERPGLSSNSIVVVPGEFSHIVKERAVPPVKEKPGQGKGSPKEGQGKPKGNETSAKWAL